MNNSYSGLSASTLVSIIANECNRPVTAELLGMAMAIKLRFGDALEGVLFYGSCLRDGASSEGLVDLYVLVKDYSSAHTGIMAKLANQWLPPNVFMLKTRALDGKCLRAKCALISLKDFETGTSSWFQSYLWGRFSQPCRVVYSRDEPTQARIHHALSNAVIRMMTEALPMQSSAFTSSTLWERALSLTYGTELRPEHVNRPLELTTYNSLYYSRITRAVCISLEGVSFDASRVDGYFQISELRLRKSQQRRWRLRRLHGRAFNVLRLVKSFFTFEGGVDYVIWKLERHLGEPIPVSPRLRRYPLLFGWPLLWRLIRDRRLR